jgi:hypothetical protein
MSKPLNMMSNVANSITNANIFSCSPFSTPKYTFIVILNIVLTASFWNKFGKKSWDKIFDKTKDTNLKRILLQKNMLLIVISLFVLTIPYLIFIPFFPKQLVGQL